MKPSCRPPYRLLPAVIAVCLAATGCERGETPAPRPAPGTPAGTPAPPARAAPAGQPLQGDQTMTTLTVISNAFPHNGTIPRQYTGEGQDISPPLAWSGVPAGARELALIADDPDAPTPQPWVHWVLYAIPPDTTGLPEGVAPAPRGPGTMRQGRNSFNKIGYGGPMPPPGHGLHHYHFRLYALDVPLNLEPGATRDALLKAIQGHILAQGTLTGTYKR